MVRTEATATTVPEAAAASGTATARRSGGEAAVPRLLRTTSPASSIGGTSPAARLATGGLHGAGTRCTALNSGPRTADEHAALGSPPNPTLGACVGVCTGDTRTTGARDRSRQGPARPAVSDDEETPHLVDRPAPVLCEWDEQPLEMQLPLVQVQRRQRVEPLPVKTRVR